MLLTMWSSEHSEQKSRALGKTLSSQKSVVDIVLQYATIQIKQKILAVLSDGYI